MVWAKIEKKYYDIELGAIKVVSVKDSICRYYKLTVNNNQDWCDLPAWKRKYRIIKEDKLKRMIYTEISI